MGDKSKRTLEAYSYWVGRFDAWREGNDLEEAAPAFLTDLKARGRSPNTVSLASYALKDHLAAQGIEINFDIPSIKMKDPEYLSPEEIELLISKCRGDLIRTVVILLYDTAARIGEILNLQYPQDIDLAGTKLRVVRKGGHQEWCRITTAGVEALETWIAKRGKKRGRLFLDWRYHDVWKRFNVAKLAAKLPNATPHQLRHSRARHLRFNAGVEWDLVRDILGHKKVATTIDIYGRRKAEDIELPSWRD